MLRIEFGDELVDAGFVGGDVVDANGMVFCRETAGYRFNTVTESVHAARWTRESPHATARTSHNCCSLGHHEFQRAKGEILWRTIQGFWKD